MLQNKSTKYFSEISSFINSDEKSLSIIIQVIKGLNINRLKLGLAEYPQALYRKNDLIVTCLLFPVFSVDNICRYLGSSLQNHFLSAKDTLYRLKNNPLMNWRCFVYKVNKRILFSADQQFPSDNPRCIIIDDSDLAKTGRRIEHTGKIWSHSIGRTLLGYKALFLGYWDGKSFFGLDFSLHKEMGKNTERPFGLTTKQRKEQFKKTRSVQSPSKQRVDELMVNKIDNAITMIIRAFKQGILFDYVLTDSWFVNEKFMRVSLACGAHLLGMGKMGKTLYRFNDKQYSALQIIKILVRNKKSKRVKCLGMFVAEAQVSFGNIPLKLIYFKTSRNSKWHFLLTTDRSLKAVKAYQTYSIRWSIEVFFKESKQHFHLGKSQSRDFDGQIADTSLSMLQYNVFSLAKRIESYETLGGLFDETQKQALELTLWQRIWDMFLEIITLLAESIEIDPDKLMTNIITMENQKQNKLISIFQRTLINAA